MKKFLTVLLALSVVFTYTFGTAFAVQTQAPDVKAANVARDIVLATATLESGAAALQKTEKTTGTYTDAAIDYAVKAAKDLAVLFIHNYAAAKAAEDEDYTGTPVTDDVALWVSGTPQQMGKKPYEFTKVSLQLAYESFITTKDFEMTKQAALAKLAAIDTSKYYVNADKNIDGVTAAKTLITKATAAINAVKATGNTIKNVYADGQTTIGSLTDKGYKVTIDGYLYGVTAADGSVGTATTPKLDTDDKTDTVATNYEGLMTRLGYIETTAQHDKDAATDKEKVGFAMAELSTFAKVTFYKGYRVVPGANGVTDLTADASTVANDTAVAWGWVDGAGNAGTLHGVAVANKLKATDAEVAAANAAFMARLQNAIDVLQVYFTETPANVAEVNASGLLNPNCLDLKAAIVLTDKVKKEYDAAATEAVAKKIALNGTTGTKLYADADIDKLLAEFKTDLYKAYKNTTSVKITTYWNRLSDMSSVIDKAIADATAKFTSTDIANAKYKVAFYDNAATAQASVTALIGKAKAALSEAKSVDEVNKIMAELDANLAKVRTAVNQTAVGSAIVAAGYNASLDAYAVSEAALKGSAYRTGSFAAAATAGKKLISEAMTVAELPGLYDQAKALFATIKTEAEITAAGQAIAAKIAALKATVTLADRDALLAAQAEVTAFEKVLGSTDADVYNKALLEVKMTTLKNAEIKSIQDAVKALPATITAADADKVKAIRTELDKYLAYYEVESFGYDGSADFIISAPTYKALTNAETAIENLGVKAVQDMIYALPSTVTAKDAAAIKAARAAYDALSKAGRTALVTSGHYAKLVIAENALNVIVAATNAKIVAGVQNTTLKATSKATKGAMKITWKKSAGYKVDGYQVYKSTKKFSGFKKAFTTKGTAYKNTKELKAGKTYFYKVRGFRTVDGVKVYTNWSNKTYKVAK